MEIKIYIDESPRKRARKADAAYAALLRTVALCQDVRKVVMNVTPTDWEVYFSGTDQLSRLANVLSTYPKLKDVTLKVRPESIEGEWEIFEGVFGLCKKGVSLCFELMDYDVDSDDEPEDVEEVEEERVRWFLFPGFGALLYGSYYGF
jgi:hypothetical protein